MTGRYAAQGKQMRTGLELWSGHTGHELVVADDESSPSRATALHSRLLEESLFVIGPYGSDSTRAVAQSAPLVWNHGAAADDVQKLPGVVSLPTPASCYLVALARACARLHPGVRAVVVTASGPFGEFARSGLETALPSLALEVVANVGFREANAAIEQTEPAAVLACGSLQRELALVSALASRARGILYGGVSPGLADFARLAGVDPEGMLAPVQWHPELDEPATLGPQSSEVVASSGSALDYVAAQAFATALIADHCSALAPDDPLSIARTLRTATFYGAFGLDPSTGVQMGHRLSVVRWRGGRQEVLAASIA